MKFGSKHLMRKVDEMRNEAQMREDVLSRLIGIEHQEYGSVGRTATGFPLSRAFAGFLKSSEWDPQIFLSFARKTCRTTKKQSIRAPLSLWFEQ